MQVWGPSRNLLNRIEFYWKSLVGPIWNKGNGFKPLPRQPKIKKNFPCPCKEKKKKVGGGGRGREGKKGK